MRLTLVGPIIVTACAVVMFHSATTGRAAEECLSAPKGAAPEGRHWYYRSDSSTGRRCWYLAEKGKKTTRQASSPPVPARRPDAEPVEAPAVVTSAEAPALASAETTPLPAGAVAPPVAPPNHVVTQFSRQWPHYERPSGTVGGAPESNVGGDTEETQVANAEEKEVPVVQPVLSAQEPVAATAPSSPPILNTQQMFILLICSLCLAGLIMGLICTASSIRTRRRIARTWEPSAAAPWHEAGSTGYRPAEPSSGPRAPAKSTGYRPGEPKVSAPVTEARGAEIPRLDDLETNLQELLDGWRKRAA